MNTTTKKPSGGIFFDVSSHWSEMPIQLRAPSHASPYPIQNFPEIIKNAIEEVEEATQAPIALIAASALAAVSAAVQGLISVERDEGLRGPASLYFLTIAASGERKTSADNFFTQAIREWELAEMEAAKPSAAEYRAKLATWQSTEEGYRQAIKNNAKLGKLSDDLTAKLNQLEIERPVEPRVPSMIRIDDTPEALGAALTRWPVAAILSNEAGIIFGAHGMNPDSVMRNLAGLNIYWDGGRLKRDRISSQSIDIHGMRVTMGLQVQPEAIQSFLDKQGVLARGSGFLARFLISHPISTQGTRYYKSPASGMPELRLFNQRLLSLLSSRSQVDDCGSLTTTYLQFDEEAKALWVDFYDDTESDLGHGGELYDIQDIASKAADNAARLSACFYAFSHKDGSGVKINKENMRAATELARWHLNEALRFTKKIAVPEEIRKAELLEKWLLMRMAPKINLIPTREARQNCTGSTRGKAFDESIKILTDHNRLKLFEFGAKKYYCLHPSIWETSFEML